MRVEIREPDRESAERLGSELGVSSTLAQVLLHRGFGDAASARDYLAPRLSELTEPSAMLDRELAADRLAAAIRRGETIAVFGDYDVDGMTSAAIVSGVLEQLGGRVQVLLASRFDGGYGLSDAALARVRAVRPSVLVTCDCGTSDHARLLEAQQAGIDTIVVDHHLVPAQALPALAFINPHRPECGFAYKGLCSAGLALSLGAAVRAKLEATLDLREWLDLVALGTVADVAPLDGDNRRLVRAGLARLGAPDARPGVVALREVAKIASGPALSAADVAFRIAPRLNAAGRLGDPSLALAVLRARSLAEARALAMQLEQQNERRKAIEAEVSAHALAQVTELYGEAPASGIVVAAEGWHRGVVGITAARLVDRFQVPAIVIAIEQGIGHGSCRAPAGVDGFEAVSGCAPQLERFGGHAAASGLTVRAEQVDALRAAFADRTLVPRGSARERVHAVDAVLGETDYALPAVRELALLEPLGEANAEPLFLLSRARVEQARVVGRGHLKLTLRTSGGSLPAFGLDLGARLPARGEQIDVVGALRPDAYRGNASLELRLVDFVQAGRAP